MSNDLICCICRNEAMRFAERYLITLGLPVTEKPAADVSHLLLPVPAFPSGDQYLPHILSDLPENVTISGGNLYSPLLAGYRTVDFLQDPYYLAHNAAITAECTLKMIRNELSDLADIPILILGWGRIGKCLGSILTKEGAAVTIAARKDSDLAMIRALGCRSIPIDSIQEECPRYRIVLNTVPEMILPTPRFSQDCLALDLASVSGMTGANVQPARGLPGKMMPAESGKLIAKTFIRLSLGKEWRK